MLRPSVQFVRLTASTAMIQENISLLKAEECPKLPLHCPNKCKVGTIPREEMEKHRTECLLEVINSQSTVYVCINNFVDVTNDLSICCMAACARNFAYYASIMFNAF